MKKSLSIVSDKPHGESSKACGVSIATPSWNVSARTFSGNAAVVTLGCAKNQVDSEVMLGVLQSSGYQIVNDVERAEVIIVNTCGFLESSVKESIDSVLAISELKQKGRLRKLIVAGCMVERYKGDISSALPEADFFMTPDQLLSVGDVVRGTFVQELEDAKRPYFLYDDSVPRTLSTESFKAYVKISEGCNRPCTFCVIPKIRGQMRSRKPESLYEELRMLGASGVKEVTLVAQDLTSYGSDHKEGISLETLIQEMERRGDVPWIRLLYAYPVGVTESLLLTISKSKNLCKYLDIPLQHASEEVLKKMKRPLGKLSPINLVPWMKQIAPDIAIRTTFIVGFPGETEEDVEELARFIRQGYFANVGIFTYSKEADTESYMLDGHIDEEEKIRRRDYLMNIQQEVVAETLSGLIGKEVQVLIEGEHEDTNLLFVGRTEFQAPEVDGVVIINDVCEGVDLVPGSFRTVLITEVSGYDLVGKALR